MKIEYLKNIEFKFWDEFVYLQPKGTVFHTSNWLKNQSGDFRILVVKEGVTIIAGFAFVISKKAGIKGIFKPPYTPYYHPLITVFSKDGNSEREIEILTMILKEIAKHNISLVFDSDIKYFFPYQNLGFKIRPKINYTIEPSLFLNSIAKRKKSTINKYIKAYNDGNLCVVRDFKVDEVLSLWCEFGKRKHISIYKDFLYQMFNEESEFENWGCIKIYTKEGKLLAAGLYLFDKGRLYNLIPIVNYKILTKQEKNIGDFLYYNLSKIALEKKLTLDYEGSEINGVEKMYRRLGGRLDLKHTATKHNFIISFMYKVKNLIN